MEKNIDQTQQSCINLTDYTPSVTFDEKLDKYKKEIHGDIVDEYKFKTFYGRDAAIIINKVLWYAVRIIIDCDFQFESYLHPPIKYNSIPRSLDQCRTIKDNWIRYLTKKEELMEALKDGKITYEQLAKKNHTFLLKNTRDILERPDDYLKVGDHIVTRKKLKYTHHGVYIGDGKVIHYAELEGKLQICEDPLVKFIALESPFYVRKYAIKFKASHKIVEDAQRSVNSKEQPEYSLVSHNCEHFATDMVMDSKSSEQVWLAVVIGVCLLGTAAVATAVTVGVIYYLDKCSSQQKSSKKQ